MTTHNFRPPGAALASSPLISILGVVAGLTIGLLLAGCGGGEDAKTPTEATPPASQPEANSEAAVPPAPPAANKGPDEVVMGGRRAPGPKRTAPGALGAGTAAPAGASATGGSKRAPARVEGAQIDFASTTVEFGTMWDVGTRTHRFEFTNVGNERLVIKAVKASCGCTATTLDRKEFAPGEGSAIEVTFTPKGDGRQSKTIDVVTNSTHGPATRLLVNADIRRFVTIEPRVVNFKAERLGAPHKAVITVTSADPDLAITSIEATVTAGGPKGSGRMGSYLNARQLPDDPATTSPGSAEARTHQIEVTLDETAPWGASYGQVVISSQGTLPDGETVDHDAIVNVVASLFNEIHADDSMFRISMVPPGTSFQRKVRLTRPSRAPFAVKSVRIQQSTMPGLSVSAVPITDAGTTGYELRLTGNTAAHTGHIGGVVVITTDVPGEEKLEIRFSGLVRNMNK